MVGSTDAACTAGPMPAEDADDDDDDERQRDRRRREHRRDTQGRAADERVT
jgi:hypothetical protein